MCVCHVNNEHEDKVQAQEKLELAIKKVLYSLKVTTIFENKVLKKWEIIKPGKVRNKNNDQSEEYRRWHLY